MNILDYYVKKVNLPNNQDELCTLIKNEATDGYKLKQILTKTDEGTTDIGAFLIFEKDVNLTPVSIFYSVDGKELSNDLLLSPSTLELIRNIGRIEIDQQEYKIKEIAPCWNTETDNFYFVIETED